MIYTLLMLALGGYLAYKLIPLIDDFDRKQLSCWRRVVYISGVVSILLGALGSIAGAIDPSFGNHRLMELLLVSGVAELLSVADPAKMVERRVRARS